MLEFTLFACGSSLMLGTFSMSIANIMNDPYVGYGIALLYWVYWNINSEKQSLFNLFPFIANPTFYEKFLAVEYLSVIVHPPGFQLQVASANAIIGVYPS